MKTKSPQGFDSCTSSVGQSWPPCVEQYWPLHYMYYILLTPALHVLHTPALHVLDTFDPCTVCIIHSWLLHMWLSFSSTLQSVHYLLLTPVLCSMQSCPLCSVLYTPDPFVLCFTLLTPVFCVTYSWPLCSVPHALLIPVFHNVLLTNAIFVTYS